MKFLYLLDEDGIFWKRPVSSFKPLILKKKLIDETEAIIVNIICKLHWQKENKIFLIYKEIQMGSGANSYMRNGCLKYEEIHKYFHHIWGDR